MGILGGSCVSVGADGVGSRPNLIGGKADAPASLAGAGGAVGG